MHLVRLEILRKVASIIFLSGGKKWKYFPRDDFLFKKVKFSEFTILFRLGYKLLMPLFLKFRDEQYALGLKLLRPSVKKLVFLAS